VGGEREGRWTMRFEALDGYGIISAVDTVVDG
jgi:hypothetical protein